MLMTCYSRSSRKPALACRHGLLSRFGQSFGGDELEPALRKNFPAFLDIGGGASPERVTKSFKAVLRDKNVKAILVNVFAGINRCDWVAKGVVDAIKELDIKIPIVVRLAGTNVEEGRKIIDQSGLTMISAETLADAANKAVTAAKQAA
jgi:malate-CoA ligase subunit beta